MKKFKKLSSFFSVCLSLSVVLGNFSLPVLAYEKDGVNFEQVRTKTLLDNSGKLIDKTSIAINNIKTLSIDKVNKQNLSVPKKKLGTDLLKLIDNSFLLPNQNRAQAVSQMKSLKQFVAKEDSVKNIDRRVVNKAHNDLVYVYVSLEATAQTSVINSVVWKATDRDEKNHLVVALVEVDKLEALASLSEVRSICSVMPPVIRNGSVVTEGDIIHQTDEVRSAYSQAGSGIKIGVISDGVNSIALSKNTGDLPEGVTVLDNSYGGDEGTAMLEIIHDMVPDAQLYFHTGFPNSVVFNNAVDDLVAAGINVIVDDLGFFDQPYFEDGTIASHVASVLATKNIVYVSAAGNDAKQHYQGNYYNGGSNFHDFSRGSAPTYKDLYVKIPSGASVQVVLQWNDSFGSSGNDYDLMLVDENGYGTLADSLMSQDGNDNPLEFLSYTNTTGSTIEADIWVHNYKGQAITKTLELFIYPSNGIRVYTDNLTPVDSIFGHPAVPGVIAVGAIDANDPGNDTIESFSSQGPVTIIGAGQRVKPDIAGIDGVTVTGAGGFHVPFYGTSAAAPHIAAIAAQLWGEYPSATGNQIRDHLLNSAVDLGTTGIDTIFGHGRADSLLDFQAGPTITSFSFASFIPVVTGTINEASSTITLTVPFGTDVTTLIPTINVSSNATSSPASGVAQNFTSPVTYIVAGADGLTQSYIVTVVAEAASSEWHIRDDVTGGDCTLIGTWSITDKKCAITQHLHGNIVIESDGITLDGNHYNLEIANDPAEDSIGVLIQRANNVTIKNFLTIKGVPTVGYYSYFSTGITVYHSDGVKILDNNIDTLSGIGIELQGVNNSIVSRNGIFNTYWGIRLNAQDGTSNGNEISYNAIGSNYYGIYVGWWDSIANTNVIRENMVWDNNYGIRLGNKANYNQIYNNNFYSNNTQVEVESGINNVFSLNAPRGGSYWDNFDEPAEGCNDANNDGLCDSPYVFNGGQDNLPWTKKDGWFIRVISPNGGEIWEINKTYEIKWDYSDVPADTSVQISLRDSRYDPNLGSGEQIIVNTTNTGSYLFQVPASLGFLSGGQLGGENVYKVVVYINLGEGIPEKFDESDAPFSITAPLSSAKDIVSFSFAEGLGVITGTNIAVTVPSGTNVTALIPTIVITGASVNPASGVAHDFTIPVTYTVIAADGLTQNYTVTVTVTVNPDTTPPSPPTINSVISPTQNSTQTISGTKEADTSIWLNGSQIVPLDSLTTWSYVINLNSGTNNLNITAKDTSGNESAAVVATIIYNPPSPPAPTNQSNGGGGSSGGSNGGGGGGGGGDDEDDDGSPSVGKITPQVAGASISNLSSDRIKSLYKKIFNRIPKATELSYWVNVKGYSLNEVKKSFYSSNEYNKKIKDLANKQGKKKGIEKLFQDIFGRSIKKNDLAYWSKQDTSILGIKFLFLNSKEYKTNSEDKQSTERRNQIASLYRNILMRPSDQNGLNYWDKTKKPLKQIRATMLNSTEFKNLLKTLEKQKGREAAFEQLFEAVFNAPADGQNYNYYVQKNKKVDLQKVKAKLMQSKRYQKQNW